MTTSTADETGVAAPEATTPEAPVPETAPEVQEAPTPAQELQEWGNAGLALLSRLVGLGMRNEALNLTSRLEMLLLSVQPDPAADLAYWVLRSTEQLGKWMKLGIGKTRLVTAVFELETFLVPASADPLQQIRNLRDAMTSEMARLRKNNKAALEEAHADLYNLAMQVEGILCPPSAEHEAEVAAELERRANQEADQIQARAKELVIEREAAAAKAAKAS